MPIKKRKIRTNKVQMIESPIQAIYSLAFESGQSIEPFTQLTEPSILKFEISEFNLRDFAPEPQKPQNITPIVTMGRAIFIQTLDNDRNYHRIFSDDCDAMIKQGKIIRWPSDSADMLCMLICNMLQSYGYQNKNGVFEIPAEHLMSIFQKIVL